VALTSYSASDWLNWARTAWQYYTPGVGVNSASGLHRSTLSWHCFTDWDVGTYIFATILARKLNLILDGSGNGDWQFNDRINKILNFLSTRQLLSGTPYRAYDWSTGRLCSDTGSTPSDGADQGRLLGALHALVAFRPSYLPQVSSIFARSSSVYDTFHTQLGGDYYSYFIAEGYAAFGYDETTVFNSLNSYSGAYDMVYGQQLPVLDTSAEPFNLAILEGPMIGYGPSQTFLDFGQRDYLAQMERWNATRKLTAWSEGIYFPDVYYIDEWVLETYTTSPQTWIMMDATRRAYSQSQYPPFAYTKVAFSFLAIYGSNPYTDALVNAVTPLAVTQPYCPNMQTCQAGFGEAVFENGTSPLRVWGSGTGGFYSDKTQEQVLAAAAYAIPNATNSTTNQQPPSTSNYSTIQSTSNINSIPGFSLQSIIIGITLGLSIILISRSRRIQKTAHCRGKRVE